MGFKKVITSQSQFVIGNFSSAEENKLFPPGFEYRVGGVIYKVREDCTKDAGSYARRVITSEGATEIMTLETIKRDLSEPDAQILKDPLKEQMEKEAELAKQNSEKTQVEEEKKEDSTDGK